MTTGGSEQSRVGVLGSGVVGQRLAAGFRSRGHDVMIGTRDPDKAELRDWLAGDGAGVRAGTFRETAEHGEILVLAVLGDAAQSAIADAGAANFTGKVVIDAMNPLDFSGGFPPKLSISGADSLGEQVQRASARRQGGQGVQHDRQCVLRRSALQRGRADDADRRRRRRGQADGP